MVSVDTTDEHDDPLDGADIGQTERIEVSSRHAIEPPEPIRGTDRYISDRNVDVEIVEDEYGNLWEETSWDCEVTKQMPRRWEEAAERNERRESRIKPENTGKLSTFFTSMVISILTIGVVSVFISREFEGMTINGEPVAVDPGTMLLAWLPILLLLVLGYIVYLGVFKGYFPRPVNGGRL